MLEAVVVELVRSAAGFRAVMLLAWHGGNAEPLARALGTLRARGARRSACGSRHVEGGDAHAGWVETSLMLALAPELVRAERPVGATEPLAVLLPRLRRTASGRSPRTASSATPAAASASEGRRLLEGFAADVGALLDATSNGARRT